MSYDRDALEAELADDEGRRRKPYRCPAGHLTIGVGHNLDANGLSEAAIDLLLAEDIAEAETTLDATDPGWRAHPARVQRAMLNLAFNLGRERWALFVNARAALARGDYAAAAAGVEASKWATQVQESRRDRVLAQLRSGEGG